PPLPPPPPPPTSDFVLTKPPVGALPGSLGCAGRRARGRARGAGLGHLSRRNGAFFFGGFGLLLLGPVPPRVVCLAPLAPSPSSCSVEAQQFFQMACESLVLPPACEPQPLDPDRGGTGPAIVAAGRLCTARVAGARRAQRLEDGLHGASADPAGHPQSLQNLPLVGQLASRTARRPRRRSRVPAARLAKQATCSEARRPRARLDARLVGRAGSSGGGTASGTSSQSPLR
ncbi:unnamed protein product, partial [Prorocentrum cordatum]